MKTEKLAILVFSLLLLSALVFFAPARNHDQAGKEKAAVPVEVAHLAALPGTASAMLLLVTQDDKLHIPITIGLYEAEAISRALRGVETLRPMTHTLLASVIDSLNGKVEKVTISSFDGQVYKATLRIVATDGREVLVDARPSDAVPVALQAGAVLEVSTEVLDKAGVPADGTVPERKPPDKKPAPEPESPGQPRHEWLI